MSNELTQLQDAIQEAKPLVERAEALARLQVNPDFKLVFMDYLLSSRINDLVLVKTQEAFIADEKEQIIHDAKINALGSLNNELTLILTQGHQARSAVDEMTNCIAEYESEGGL